MQLEKIYAGNWMPRTMVHLNEVYQFFKSGTSHLGLDQDQLAKFYRELEISNVDFKEGNLNYLSAKIGDLELNYWEDGTFLLSTEVSDIKRDFERTTNTLLNKLIPATSFLQSLGAPMPKVFSDLKSVLPVVVIASQATEDEVRELYRDFSDDIDYQVNDQNFSVYWGKNIIVVVGSNINDINYAHYLIFAQECTNQFQKLIDMHRVIWDEISAVRERRLIQYKDLPAMRDTLLDLRKDISFFRSRLDQMDIMIKSRQDYLAEFMEVGIVRTYISGRLTSLIATQSYLVDLWSMTGNYADTTMELVGLLYQENGQKELNTLQVIFMIGVLASFLTLGAMPGAMVRVFDKLGVQLYSAEISSFSLGSLIQFGLIALVVSTILYFLLHYAFTHLKRFRVIDVAKLRTAKNESIIKHLSQ